MNFGQNSHHHSICIGEIWPMGIWGQIIYTYNCVSLTWECCKDVIARYEIYHQWSLPFKHLAGGLFFYRRYWWNAIMETLSWEWDLFSFQQYPFLINICFWLEALWLVGHVILAKEHTSFRCDYKYSCEVYRLVVIKL